MQCTAEQIEEKRRLAQLKLQSKRDSAILTATHNQQNQSPNAKYFSAASPIRSGNNSHSPNKPFTFKPYDKRKPVLNFYGGTSKIITADFYLISDSQFEVNLSNYSSQAIDIFKTISSRSYNTKSRLWSFHIKDYAILQERLSSLQPSFIIGKIPAYARNSCQTVSNYDNIDLSGIDSELLCTLMPFQEQGVRFGIDKKGRCLIADDMGLGKTFQALGIASYYKHDWPLLIATTSSMKNVWEDAIHQYLPSISLMETQYMVSAKDYIKESKVLIVSHDMLARAIDKLKDRNFGVFIIDESHIFKNYKAKCTQAAASLARIAKRVVLLSGTPALSRPSELYSQLSLIDEKFFGNFFDYSRRYCDGKTTNFGWDASGQSNLQELEVILYKRFMIRRTKEDVLKLLPNKKQEVITLDVKLSQLDEEDRNYLNALAAKYNNIKNGGAKHAALVTFFAESSKIKIPSVCSYILQVLESVEKFLVFAHHQKMLDAIQQVLIKMNKKFIRIDGSTTSEQRKYYVDKFQLDDKYVCAILSITAANAGLTLTRAQLIIFAELHWNPSILSQAESRAHRIGQESEVIARYLVAPGTADDPMWKLIQEKQKTLNQIGLSKDSFDNVTVSKQQHSNKLSAAQSLNSSMTSFDTMDISSYFESPEPKRNRSDASKTDGDNISDSINEMELLDDGMDDIFSNLDM